MGKATNCYARPLDRNYKPMVLPDNEAVWIGRNPETDIRDLVIAKDQLILKANYEKRIVECMSRGINPSGCNGYALLKDLIYTFVAGDRVEAGLGKYIYELVFEPVEEDEDKVSKRCKVDDKNSSHKQEVALPESFKGEWQKKDFSVLVYTPDVPIKGNRIAAFDMDGTLITPKSGNRFPKDKDDWQPTFQNLNEKLKDLYLQGFRIVIFSNQASSNTISDTKQKVVDIIQYFGIPIQVFLATTRDKYRKPAPGMWNMLLELINEDINMDESFYVGDAAGRHKNWAPHKPKDHSIADRLFAINLGLKFYTPEEYFLGAKSVPYEMPEFDPNLVKSTPQSLPVIAGLEVILMVGCPASGKTNFCLTYLIPLGYVHISRDNIGSSACCKVLEENLKLKKSCVIDNTNPTESSRKPFLLVCQKYGIPCKCFYMNLSHKHCLHNNKFRNFSNDKHKLDDIVLHSYRKKFEKPKLEEGFSEICEFGFNPVFKNKEEEKLYKTYYLES